MTKIKKEKEAGYLSRLFLTTIDIPRIQTKKKMVISGVVSDEVVVVSQTCLV
ncbi:MAG: hypothetical protein JSW11_18290 [Candidatus Heimdallarchaeota archaeon]|nr:MAG: hypothetical protein JSW11_18290 [Candidatus Heimdallarchaeota archaeon]